MDGEPDKRAGAVLKTDGARKGLGCKSSAILRLTRVNLIHRIRGIIDTFFWPLML